MTIIQCMIMAYVLTIEQVQTLQTMDASLSRDTCDDEVLTKSSWENPITTCIHGHFFLWPRLHNNEYAAYRDLSR